MTTDDDLTAAYQQYLDDCQRHGCECLALTLPEWARVQQVTG